ncbi:MAG: fluoride efflux transporter CrcB [Anaerolineaceae bacterium]
MEKVVLISIGAIVGANARYWTTEFFKKQFDTSFPLGTLVINILGSFLLGLIMSLSTERLPIDPKLKMMITVGFLGAYTTFSTYSYESLTLLLSGQIVRGVFNLLGSSMLGGLAAGLGIWLSNRIG